MTFLKKCASNNGKTGGITRSKREFVSYHHRRALTQVSYRENCSFDKFPAEDVN